MLIQKLFIGVVQTLIRSANVPNSGHFGDHSQEDFDAKLTEFKLRLKEANFELALFAFYNGPEADALDDNDYGNQLADVSTILSTEADVAWQGGLEDTRSFYIITRTGCYFSRSRFLCIMGCN